MIGHNEVPMHIILSKDKLMGEFAKMNKKNDLEEEDNNNDASTHRKLWSSYMKSQLHFQYSIVWISLVL